MMDAYIFDALRSPRGRGKADGALHALSPVNLLAQVLTHLERRNNLDTTLLDDVIMGCVEPAGEQGADIARTALLMADYAQSAPGVVVSRFCASGLEAVNIARAKVMSGEAELVIAGGVESMSRVPLGSSGGAYYTDPVVTEKLGFVPQGISADLIATLQGFSREQVDAYACESQKRAAYAWEKSYFNRSVVPLFDDKGALLLDRDEHMRPETTIESLANLNPAFAKMAAQFDPIALSRYSQISKINHVHTAGNSSGIVDGAAALLIGTKAAGENMGLSPRARIRAAASIGTEPTIMLTGPTPSAEKALLRAHMSSSDIDIWELNEAFAAVVLLFMREMKISPEMINVNGGAIAMGHPLGATGAMLIGTALDELERQDKNIALVM